MGLTRGMKRPVEILYRRLRSPVHGHASASAHKGALFTTLSEKNAAGVPSYSRSIISGFGIHFSRNYSSAPEQLKLIKQLRERTSAPINEVKTALVACNWDIEAAQKELRKRGVALASKKSSRTAGEGFLALAQDQKKAVIIELNCETDFVARNEIFQHLALNLARSALVVDGSAQGPAAIPVVPESLEDLKINFDHPKLTGEKTVRNAIIEVAAIMGENVKLGGGFEISVPSYGVISTYLHTCPQPGIGRIAGLLSLEVEGKDAPLDAVQRVGSQIAMHVVATKPLFLTKEDVSSDVLGNERDVLRSQAESTGKSQVAIDKMVEGRLRKYFEEVVLMEQKFIMDDSLTIKMVLEKLSKEVGSTVKIGNFLRVEVGEGLKRLQAASETEPLSQTA